LFSPFYLGALVNLWSAGFHQKGLENLAKEGDSPVDLVHLLASPFKTAK
jgi:hypothetical protein